MTTETERSPKPAAVRWEWHMLTYCLFHPGVELDEHGDCKRCDAEYLIHAIEEATTWPTPSPQL